MAGATCIFGCAGAEDSIEHYSCCWRVASFARRRLGLRAAAAAPHAAQLAEFLLVGTSAARRQPVELTLGALRTAAVYKVHNWWRHAARRTPQMAQEALDQAVVDMVAGHARATRILAEATRPVRR